MLIRSSSLNKSRRFRFTAQELRHGVMAVRTLFVVGLAGALVSCTAAYDDGRLNPAHLSRWVAQNDRPELTLEVERLTHLVRFAPGHALLSDEEMTRLRDFIVINQLSSEDSMTAATVSLASDSPWDQSLEDERMRAVEGIFLRLGMAHVTEKRRARQPAEFARHQDAQQTQDLRALCPGQDANCPQAKISVTVTRSHIVKAKCQHRQGVHGIRPEFVFGCANQNNLAAMLVDPLDLLGQRRLGPGDGAIAAGNIQRYRDNEVKKSDSSGLSDLAPGG